MSMKRYSGSCHCGAVKYDVDLDLSKGTIRCNCSICKKARAWFAFVGGNDLHLIQGEESMARYRWTPAGKSEPFVTYRFCKSCGVRMYGTGEAEFMGGRFYALAVSTLDTADIEELAAAPLKYIDNLHDRSDQAPADIRLL